VKAEKRNVLSFVLMLMLTNFLIRRGALQAENLPGLFHSPDGFLRIAFTLVN
jgi:hypothetical protein